MPTLLAGLTLALTKFVNPDHSFSLSVPPSYVIHTGKDKPSNSYIPVCHDDSAVCVTYPIGRFKGTNFQDASVEVMIRSNKTPQSCTNPGQNDSSSRTINGTRFAHASGSDGAASTHIDWDRYFGFSKGKCFELAANITYGSFAAYDPGTIKQFTKQDEKRLNAELMRIVDSFRALTF